MNRFTEKIDKTKSSEYANKYIILGAYTDIPKYSQAVDKFGSLEDIEEKRGVSLSSIDQALEIIAKKNVDIQFLMGCGSVNVYNVPHPKNYLTLWEFDLVKEVLNIHG